MSRHPESGVRSGAFRKSLGRAVMSCSLVAAAVAASPAMAQGDNGPVVDTAEGPVRGVAHNGVNVFLGIPYAAPPVGQLRWRPPKPVEPWTDVRDATHFGNNCPQITELGVFAGPPSTTEDCLFLNVFTPGDIHRAMKAPVIVWIHGGGNVDGESNDYDGSKLARGGPIRLSAR